MNRVSFLIILLLMFIFSAKVKAGQSIYDKEPSGVIFSPFNLEFSSMDKLLLINFEEGSDQIYSGLEPQIIDGKLRIIAWRNDGFVDVYQQPSMLSVDNLDVAGKGLANFLERDMEDFKFEINSKGVDLYFSFEDKKGREVEARIKEKGDKVIKPFDLLAPVGGSSENPSYLPLYFLYDFYFVRRAGTESIIKIAGKKQEVENLPFFLDWSRCYFTRYSSDPFLVEWNADYEGSLSPLGPRTDGEVWDEDVRYSIRENNGYYEIEGMSISQGEHQLRIDFSPAIPDIIALKDGVIISGKFLVSTSREKAGSISGDYQIDRVGEEVLIEINPSGGWKPKISKWELRFIYFFGSDFFKDWPKPYNWTARINLEGDQVTMNSKWEIKE
ncbi:hypothetical protein [Halonatronum saccharophilum]|uniref:hypothetical protein n=1 Tax=Halonatronum saccharophilum TaxID=150060 RepID=UPI000486A64F|nr:hypothetical protein [Halonatronum saccharophilum]